MKGRTRTKRSQRPVTLADAEETLLYFNEKVDRLQQLPFTKYVSENVVSTPTLLSRQEFDESSAEPSLDSIEAFVLTLRLFVQNNEPISLANITALYQQLPVSVETKGLVRATRDQLNRHLDAFSPLGLDGKRLTYREIFDTLLYGWLAHGNDVAKRRKAAKWRAVPRRFAYLRALFLMSLMDFLETLYWFRAINRDTLGHLTAPPHRR